MFITYASNCHWYSFNSEVKTLQQTRGRLTWYLNILAGLFLVQLIEVVALGVNKQEYLIEYVELDTSKSDEECQAIRYLN